MDNSKITIILGTYNGEKYIEKQLLSLYNQTKQPDEVIISDDCSTDKTKLIVKNFISKNNLNNWTLLDNKTNKGFFKNFISMLEKTTGDIIFFCDQDDIWKSNKIEIMYNYLKSNPNILSLSCDFNTMDMNDKINKEESLSLSNSTINKVNFYELLEKSSILGCCMCFRRSLLSYINLNDKIQCYGSHDTYINLLSSLKDGTYKIPDKLINYRIHQNNTSFSLTQKRTIDFRLKTVKNRRLFLEGFLESINDSLSNYNINYIIALKKSIILNKKRESVLEKKSILKSILLIKFLSTYKKMKGSFIGGIKLYFTDLYYVLFLRNAHS